MCLESSVLAVLAAQHRDNRGLSREEAELQYIREALLLEAPLNAHLYRLRRSKNEAGPGRILLAICARGVRVYAEEETPRIFAWNNIGKLCFDVRRIFEIIWSRFCVFRGGGGEKKEKRNTNKFSFIESIIVLIKTAKEVRNTCGRSTGQTHSLQWLRRQEQVTLGIVPRHPSVFHGYSTQSKWSEKKRRRRYPSVIFLWLLERWFQFSSIVYHV